MGDISKPDTNAVVPAALNFFFGGAGYLFIGQQKKGIICIVAWLVLWMCGLGWIVSFISGYDGYLLGQKLEKGESIGENENGLEFLNAIFK